ncbi:MAG: hypothetical protein KatS3mg111_1147 [Pirellulaceae bacterium]|nr:MAG: hypothetical protein KatS3mg111_1147 [Pirellulaceae bacterium]
MPQNSPSDRDVASNEVGVCRHPSTSAAVQVRNELMRRQWRLVTAESCTAGRVASTLAEIPGASQWLCGGWVVYRNDSKHRWLGIPLDLLTPPGPGPVSMAASTALAQHALSRTPEARVAMAVTGDIGPDAPAATDGHIFTVVAFAEQTRASDIVLAAPPPRDQNDVAARRLRMDEATTKVIEFLAHCLRATSPRARGQ